MLNLLSGQIYTRFFLLTLLLKVHTLQAAGMPVLEEIVLDKVEVNANAQRMLGLTNSASEGTVTAEQLRARPLLRPAEVMEAIPGMMVTQHSGGGKANQYFLRGFNLDHGSDFATYLNGMPVNMVTHAHGQGYMDLNFLIPELIGGLRYQKGTYAAEDGDFAVAGSARIDYVRQLSSPYASLTLGEYGYRRLLSAGSQQLNNFDVLGAFEFTGNDGPWSVSENLNKYNAVLRLSSGTPLNGSSVMMTAYQSDWVSTEQVPERAVSGREIGRYGTLAPTDGGKTHRYSLIAEHSHMIDNARWKYSAYVSDYALNLYSTPSGFLDGQHEQEDKRMIAGGDIQRNQAIVLGGYEHALDLGVKLRHDRISNLGLYQTSLRQRDSVTRTDKVQETSYGVYANASTQWNDWLRSSVGLRWDYFQASVQNKQGILNTNNSGDADDHQLSPKLGLAFGPFGNTEFFVNWGHGFHSNDARGATARTNVLDGSPVMSVPLIAKANSSEFGVRTQLLPNWHSSLTFWQTALDSELIYIGDSGVTEPKGGSKRRGVEWSNYYNYGGVIFDADIAASYARFDKADAGGRHIPNSIPLTASFAVTYDQGNAWFGGLRTRYMGAYPLEETGEFKSQAFWTTNLKLGYRYNKNIQLSLDVLNLFNSRANDIEYYGASCTQLEGASCKGGEGVEGRLIHPLEPRSLRLAAKLDF